jgi:hypothetical protein
VDAATQGDSVLLAGPVGSAVGFVARDEAPHDRRDGQVLEPAALSITTVRAGFSGSANRLIGDECAAVDGDYLNLVEDTTTPINCIATASSPSSTGARAGTAWLGRSSRPTR